MNEPRRNTPEDDLDRLWQTQETPKMDIALDHVMKESRTFQVRVRIRNALEYAAGAIVLFGFGRTVLDAGETLAERIGSLAVMLGTVALLTHLRLRGHAAVDRPGPSVTTGTILRFHRRELERQRDLLRRVPLWYLGPLVPGLLIILIGRTLTPDTPHPVLRTWIVSTVVFALVFWANRVGVRKLEARIAALPSDDDLR